MKQKKHPIRHLMLLAAMLFSITASAHDFEVDGFYYNVLSFDDLTCEVTCEGSGSFYYSGDITIPKQVTYNKRTFSVTSIGSNAFSWCSGLTSVNIPNSVTSIGDEAFRNSSELTSVNIPNSVTSIGSCAFYFCSGLTSVTIGNSVTEIGSDAFGGCSGLTSFTIPSSVTSIGYSVFEFCTGLESLVIEDGLDELA